MAQYSAGDPRDHSDFKAKFPHIPDTGKSIRGRIIIFTASVHVCFMGLFNIILCNIPGRKPLIKKQRLNALPGISILLFLFLLISNTEVFAQASAVDSLSGSITVDHIFIIGNRVTKERIIRRELDINEGGTYPLSSFEALLKRNEEKITNTSLFVSVNISRIDLPGHKADIIIRVVEQTQI